MPEKAIVSLIKGFTGTPLRATNMSSAPRDLPKPAENKLSPYSDGDSSDCEASISGSASADRSKSVSVKRAWTAEEDEMLIEAVHKFGAQRWSLISSHLPGRVGKQCRERWCNHLCPEVTKGDWTAEEDMLIAEGVAELGTKWSEIVKRLPGRTDNAIKNRFNSNKRREVRAQRRDEIAAQKAEDHSEENDDASSSNSFGSGKETSKDCKGGGMIRRMGIGGSTTRGSGSKRARGESARKPRRAKAGTSSPGEKDCAEEEGDPQTVMRRKRQRVIELATRLAESAECRHDEVDGASSDSLMQELMDEAIGYAQSCTGSAFAEFGRTEEPLDLEHEIDELLGGSRPAEEGSMPKWASELLGDGPPGAALSIESLVGDGRSGAESQAESSPPKLSASKAAGFGRRPGGCAGRGGAGLTIDVDHALTSDESEEEAEAIDASHICELKGEVMITNEGAVPITPANPPSAAMSLEGARGRVEWGEGHLWGGMGGLGQGEAKEAESDWLALYKPEVRPDSPAATDTAETEQALLLPLLTPSNTKLCAALVDAFLPGEVGTSA